MQKENLDRAVGYIESWIDFNFPHSRIPGMVVAIQQGDKIVFEKAYGFANLERKVPMRKDTIFRIASHSKMFTTVALLQLAEQKKIVLTKPITTYLPWLAKAKDAHYAKITTQQLLQHGAGIIRDGEESNFWNLTRSFPGKERLKQEFLDTALTFGPGKKFKYSNYGFSLLGFLIEEVSSVSYADYIQKNILDPLKMHHTGTDINTAKDLKNFAVGYSREDANGKRKAFKNVSTSAMASATGLYSIAADLCKFSRIFYEPNKILSKKSLRQMSTVKWDTSNEKNKAALYGMGSTQVKIGDRYYLGHSGGFPGFITFTAIDIKHKLSIIVLTNAIDGEAWTVRSQVAKLLQLFERQTYSAKTKQRDIFEGRYEGVWEVIDVINTVRGLVANSPFEWGVSEPLMEYRHLTKNTFIIDKANGFYGVGEKAVFVGDKKGKITKIINAGSTLKRVN